jgi:xanthine dehydrogenase YagS FAD-binding subunit
MRLFEYRRSSDLAGAVHMAQAQPFDDLAFGDLLELSVLRPSTVVVVNGEPQDYGRIECDETTLRLGAFVRVAQLLERPEMERNFPVLAQSVRSSACARSSVDSVGGSVLQRTRCLTFRNPGTGACNKREPGSGCAAMLAPDRRHAVLGVSPHCIAAYPGDLAQALVALDAEVEITGEGGTRTIPIEDLHVLPGDAPDVETVLRPGELITRFIVPVSGWSRRSVYLRQRDPQSYEAALVSAAVALDMERGVIRQARVALGGVATKPWRANAAEALLAGQRASGAVFREAARAAFAAATWHKGTAFKLPAGQKLLIRALRQAAALR